MNKNYAVLAVLLLAVVVALMTACQTKEVTSAKVYIQQDNWDKAIEQLEMAVEMYPNDAEAHYLLGEGYGNRGDWARMNEMFAKSLAISPMWEAQIKNTREKYWVTNFNSGVNRINGNDTQGAIRQFKTCLKIDPKRIEAYRNLAISYVNADSLSAAKDCYLKLLEIQPDHAESIHALANIHFQLEEYDKVIELEKKALEINPADTDAVANIALAYDYLGEKEKAMEEYRKALEANPNEKDLIFNLARLYYINGEYDEAIALFTRVITQSPDDYDANLNVGNAYLSMGDAMRKALVDKDNAGESVSDADYARLKEFYSQAIPYLERALEIKDTDPNVWNNLGVAHVNVGNAEKGKECFDKADSLRK